MTSLQIEMTASAIILFTLILFNLRRSNMSIKNSILWFLLPIVFIIVAIFPDPFSEFANWLGFETLANFIFVAIIALLILLVFSLTIAISNQQNKITKLIQEISLLKNQQDKNK